MALPSRPIDDADLDRFIAELLEQPEVLAARAAQEQAQAGSDTQSLYRGPDGTWTALREALHAELTEAALASGRTGELLNPPLAYIVLGLPGSGKTTRLLPRIRAKHPDATWVIVDADLVKVQLPDFTVERATLYHEESRYVAKERIWTQAIAERLNIIALHVGGSPDRLARRIDLLAEEGYVVRVWRAAIPVRTSVFRVARRFINQGGRWVPVEAVQDMAERLDETWEALSANGAIDDLQDVDTSLDPQAPV